MRNCYPFKERVDKLQQTLKDWRPETIWQLRYSGYGGVDPVGLYAFYFATIFGILTIMGLAGTGAQTFAAFNALPSNG
jgi:ABC-type transporter Mla maintaining outer membrane lipid asymmetry permease subunit MlaE